MRACRTRSNLTRHPTMPVFGGSCCCTESCTTNVQQVLRHTHIVEMVDKTRTPTCCCSLYSVTTSYNGTGLGTLAGFESASSIYTSQQYSSTAVDKNDVILYRHDSGSCACALECIVVTTHTYIAVSLLNHTECTAVARTAVTTLLAHRQ